MTVWRPPQTIRVVALALLWREGRLLTVEVRDDAGRLKGLRPLGGGVAFGEAWRDALRREMREELGLDATIRGEPLIIENIFTHEGAVGHEIVFLAQVEADLAALPPQDAFTFHEDHGAALIARWIDPNAPGAPLFPEGLERALIRLSEEAPAR